jgi:hypothetical protein
LDFDCLPPVVNNEESIFLFAGMVLSREISTCRQFSSVVICTTS